MQRNSLTKWFGASALALSLAVLPSAMPAAAQTTTGTGTTDTTTAPGTTGTTTGTDPVYATETEDDGFDWGWLGLLGLIGLAGLMGRKDNDTATRYRTTDDVTTTTTPGSRY
ncbi:WGxxGxxG family protein [Pseudanabaena sp. FACHB-2040]|uniref:WGxxGxxG family protein n=1 Tax=Pseudanabaena sp. FACHB-2040 TaxID=2692859 RepID=UPI0016824F70|nr:WGxxGxxG family protein [Pseudanabaena sp. FACHB-2040]MBD0267363.1 WGxxGxxG-CTERM domain-containing protein [Cyanobacteria bacterium Co-bin8]MBD2258542.1 WGxxGxxG-CTERM domain-containing protein [Pseudanabaena sp. FACHB-2040]